MTKKNGTKRSLLMSAVALVLCFSMLVGSTFAWFTDSVTSSGNIIASGKLDVEMYWANGTADPDDGSTSWTTVSGAIFNYDKWEPGYVEAKHIMIKNAGTLAFKYRLNIVPTGTVSELANVIDVYFVDNATVPATRDALATLTPVGTLAELIADPDGAAYGTLLADDGQDTKIVTIALKMQESAGNQYQELSIGSDFSVVLMATQLTAEEDAFDDQYDKDSTYPANIVVSTAAPAVDVDNKTTAPVTLSHTDDTSSVSAVTVTVPEGTKLEDTTTDLVLKIEEQDDVNAAVATQITSEQTATTYEISLDGVANTNTEEIEVSLFIDKGLVDVKLYHHGTLIPSNYDAVTGELTFTTTGFSPFTVVSSIKLFDAGAGTKENPYIINEAEDLLNISEYYHEYKYYKVADGVETLDMTGVGRIYLNGSFDGNGVTMNNLTTALFQTVGKVGVAQEIKISNLTANVHTTDGRALVRNIFNPGTTTFENVTMHGYIEGQYNMGSFYNYGTANSGDSEGADYTVSFVNAKSDVTLVCTTGNAIGGMLGHGYEGANYKLSINMDEDSGYTGEMYTTGTATCYQVMAMCSHATYVLNGVETSRYEDTYPSTRLTVAKPEAKNDGYYVAPVDGVDHYVVFVNAQMTAYDENDVQIPNLSGMTWPLGNVTIPAEGFDGKVFDPITSATIVNGVNHNLGYAMDGGVLTIYSGRSENYASGWVTLQVNQYAADGALLATGIVTVHTFPEP